MGAHTKNGAASEDIRYAAVRLVNTDGMIVRIGRRKWQVASESQPGCFHTVHRTNKRIICDCRTIPRGTEPPASIRLP